MVERGAFEDAMDAAFANVRWMQVREEKPSRSSSESFFFDAQGRRFKELHDIYPPVGLDFGGNWIPVINPNDRDESEGWVPCRWQSRANIQCGVFLYIEPLTLCKRSESSRPNQPNSTQQSLGGGNGSITGSSGSGSGSGIVSSSRPQQPPSHPRHGSSAPYAHSLYAEPVTDGSVRGGSTAGASDIVAGGGLGATARSSASMSVPVMEQKLAELLLLSNSPDIDSGRIMAAAASLKRDADAVLQDPSLTLQQRTAFRKLRDGVDQLQQTIKNPRMQRAAAAASSGSTAAAGKLPSSLPRNYIPPTSFVGNEEVDDDWTPRTQNFEEQKPLLLQQQLLVRRLQQEELDFEAGVAEDRRSNLSQIGKDAAQIHELFREVAQCVQQGGEQLQFVDHMVDDAHSETRHGAREILHASKQTSSNIGIGAVVGGAIGAGVGSLLGPVGVAAIGGATAVVGGAIAKGVNVLKQHMIEREARKAGIRLDDD